MHWGREREEGRRSQVSRPSLFKRSSRTEEVWVARQEESRGVGVIEGGCVLAEGKVSSYRGREERGSFRSCSSKGKEKVTAERGSVVG